jgi:SAM-dependent methyltransferase
MDDASTALVERFVGAGIAAMELFTVHLGLRHGLYRALHDLGPATPRSLAAAAHIHPRYAREWLEQQAVAGLLASVEVAEDPYESTFELPAAHVRVLLDEDSPYFVAPMAGFMAGIAGTLPALESAFRTGEGVPYAAYGADTRDAIAGLNRPMYRGDLAKDWLAALPDIVARLTSGGSRVLDLGCGEGWSSVALAEAFPGVRVDGVDLDEPSLVQARRHAMRAGVADRVTFTTADAAVAGSGTYELICIFEALHDMADPVAALSGARTLLADGGAVLIADEKVAESFTAPGDDIERLNYGFSVMHCLPATRAEGAVEEAGTVLRPGTVRRYAEQAGFERFEILPIAHDLWRFYRLGAR